MKWEEVKKYNWIIILIVVLIILDQGIKLIVENNFMGQDITIIQGVMNFTGVTNEGLAFSIGKTKITAIITDILILAMVIRFMVVQRDKMYKRTQISLSLVLAGGFGNLIDRIFRKGIVDYINLSPLIEKFPIFNISDIFIIVGFLIFVAVVTINTFGLIKGKEKIG